MARLHIVMATRNGAPYLRAQLRSLLEQSFTDWALILSDDGSRDQTAAIAQQMIPPERLTLIKGPQQGLAANFWNGLMQVPADSYLAFCDQDDVWHQGKLHRAMVRLAQIDGPALYTADRWITDAALGKRRIDRRRAGASFAQRLYRNDAAGHTCVISPGALRLLKRAAPTPQVPFHDWWAALVLAGAGAMCIHDPHPVLLYRQHASNVIGARGGRLRHVLCGDYRAWIEANCAALTVHAELLTPNAQRALAQADVLLRRHPMRLYGRLAATRIPFASRLRLD